MTDAATTAWVSAVVAASGSVSAGRQTIVDALIVGLKSDGVWSKLDRLWLFAAENTQSALIDLVGLVSATPVSSPTFTPDQGYAGDGTTSYIDTLFIPSTHGVTYTLNSAHFSVWDTESPIPSAGVASLLGCADTSQTTALYPNFNATFTIGVINEAGSEEDQTPWMSGVQHLIVSRTGSNSVSLYGNGSVSSGSPFTANTADALGTRSFFVGGVNNAALVQGRADQIAAVSMGGGLNATEAANLYARLNTYMGALVSVPEFPPNSQTDWPNPVRRASRQAALDTNWEQYSLGLYQPPAAVQFPPGENLWINPPPRGARRGLPYLDWNQYPSALYGPAVTAPALPPGENLWTTPPPQAARRGLPYLDWNQYPQALYAPPAAVDIRTIRPVNRYQYPKPSSFAAVTAQYVGSPLPLLTAPPPPPPTAIPNRQFDWPVPRGARRNPQDWQQSATTVGIPSAPILDTRTIRAFNRYLYPPRSRFAAVTAQYVGSPLSLLTAPPPPPPIPLPPRWQDWSNPVIAKGLRSNVWRIGWTVTLNLGLFGIEGTIPIPPPVDTGQMLTNRSSRVRELKNEIRRMLFLSRRK
jgi:hypothetical protein